MRLYTYDYAHLRIEAQYIFIGRIHVIRTQKHHLVDEVPPRSQPGGLTQFGHLDDPGSSVVHNVVYPNIFSPEVDKLYDQYKGAYEDYISSKVLPSLRGKENMNLVKELLRTWNNYKIMLRWLSRFFHSLARYYIPKKGLPTLEETSHSLFYNKVYEEIKDQVIDANTSLIEMEGEGERTNLALAKQVLSIFEEIGGVALKNYEKDIEDAMVEASAKFYSKMALDWMATSSYDDYMLKVEQCLEKEKSRVSEYLKPTTRNKVLEVVQHELLNAHASKLEEKRASILHEI